MKYLTILLLCLSLYSCNESEKHKVTRLVKKWQNKEIKFPDEIIFTQYATDTIKYKIDSTKFKILIYVDSLGCSRCEMRLSEWKKLINRPNYIAKESIQILFFIHPENLDEIKYLLKRDTFELPICIDIKDQLNKLNHFPIYPMLQTFLLNRENKVLAVGNPILNPDIKDLYFEIISNNLYN
jgi:hypothetical protein